MGIEAIPFLLGFIVAYSLYLIGVSDALCIITFGLTVIFSAGAMLYLAYKGKL